MTKCADSLVDNCDGLDRFADPAEYEARLLYEIAAPGYGSLLADSFGSPRALVGVGFEELESAGIPSEIARRLLACWEIFRRARSDSRGPLVRCPDDAASHLIELVGDCPQERVAVLPLDCSHAVLTAKVVFQGGLDRSVVDPKIIFSELLRQRAGAFVMAHNHPSGNLDPSRHDVSVTERLASAAELLDIAFLDHLIISGDRWVSMRELGCLSPLDVKSAYYLSARS